MKFIAVTLALAAAALAADTPATSIPPCANDCITGATTGTKIAGCNQGDIKCVCSNSNFLDSIACCLADACDADGLTAAVSFARALCGGAGVEVPEEVVCKSGDSNTSGDATGTATDSQSSSTPTGTDADSTADSADSTESPAASNTATGGGGDSAGTSNAPMAGGLLGGALAVLLLV
ncbi:hypothetical protein jhhlp_002379 [Lomentospora prolificans]|uniref:CFEM domain-containing protein n=1 Tax=Lomentospora prolificans TaxID=41688 RepID=A0A2N3NDX5_9PEZI|nr:hypothetical protein jhhlp_002379 [Lomentospora prolificans]